MPGKAAKVVITKDQQAILREMTVSRACPQKLAEHLGLELRPRR